MTDKKLTDEEIIKRLERCVKRGNRNYDTDIVLDLINRQKSEIERLKECPNFKTVEQIKVEAYKEFVEKLKEELGDCHIVSDGEYCGFDCGDIHECIDNLLKEMVGDEE